MQCLIKQKNKKQQKKGLNDKNQNFFELQSVSNNNSNIILQNKKKLCEVSKTIIKDCL